MKNYKYKIKELPILQFIIRLLALGWICFAYIKYQVNPDFFGATIALAIIIILGISEKSIIATNNSLLILHQRWIPFLNEKEKIMFSEIAEIEYTKTKINGLPLILNFIFYVPGTNEQEALLTIHLKNGESYKYRGIGTAKQNKKLIAIIKEHSLS